MVYNYFTPVNQDDEEAQKIYHESGQFEFDILTEQLDEYNQMQLYTASNAAALN